MRVISGTAKGRRLIAPKGNFPTRPVADKVKGAIFNILFDVEGLRVLDLFAGTGAVGIEALSRGASYATFVENHPNALQALKKNIETTGFKNAKIIPFDVFKAIKKLSGTTFDLIFVDPPYSKNLVNKTIELVVKSGLLEAHSMVVVEHSPDEEPQGYGSLILTETRKYGQTRISFLKARQTDEVTL